MSVTQISISPSTNSVAIPKASMMNGLLAFFAALPDMAAMGVVESIFHNYEEEDDAEEGEVLEWALEQMGYSYLGLNSIVYLRGKSLLHWIRMIGHGKQRIKLSEP